MTVTPAMIKAAWVEARRWWPKEIVEAKIPQWTRDFLTSVAARRTWTVKQLEAIKKTLKWVFERENERVN